MTIFLSQRTVRIGFFSRLRRHLVRECRDCAGIAGSFSASCCRQKLPTLDCNRDVAEQFHRKRHFLHLEGHLSGKAHHLRTDLDVFLSQRSQRPVPHRCGQHRLGRWRRFFKVDGAFNCVTSALTKSPDVVNKDWN